MPWGRWLPLVALLPLTALLQEIASRFPQAVESVYSRGVYRAIARSLAWLTGWFPFSLAEALVVSLAAWITWVVTRAAGQLLRKRRSVRNLLLHAAVSSLAVAGCLYGLGISLWALNYQRLPLAQSAGLDVSPGSVEELAALTRELVARANTLREQVDEDRDGVMRLTRGRAEALRRARFGFDRIGREYAVLDGRSVGRPKGVLLSWVMSWIGPSGIYSPYTGEPNVNMHLPQSEFPSTVCHEMAHQLGFAREDEANFIGYLAARAHPDVDFQYGGALEALSYSLRALARSDRDSYLVALDSCSAGVKRDWAAERAHSERYRTSWSKVSRRINDAYLKSQGQTEGVQSYGRMVELLIADQRRTMAGTD